MKTPTFALLAIILFSGCSSTKYIAPEMERVHGDTLTVTEFNNRVARSFVMIQHREDGDIFTGNLVCSKDSCYYFDPRPGVRRGVPISSVIKVEKNDAVRGTILGTVGGALAGALIAGTIAWAAMGSKEDAGLAIAGVGGLGFLAGGITGYLIGSSRGETIDYWFLPLSPGDSVTTY